MSTNSTTLLSRSWIIASSISISVNVIIQILVRYYQIKVPNRNSCTSDEFASWTVKVRYVEAMAYFTKIITQLSPYMYKRARNFSSTLMVTSTISFIAGTSALLTATYNWGGTCEDIFGVQSPATQIGEWTACVPLLVYTVVSIDNVKSLGRMDLIKIISIALCIICYDILHLRLMLWISILMLVFSFIFWFITMGLMIIDVKPQCTPSQQTEVFVTLSGGDDFQYLVRNRLNLLLLLLMPTFVIVYILAAFRVFDRDIIAVLFIVSNLSTKLMFSVVAYDAHVEVLARRLIDEKTANDVRRAILKYILQEVRTPLSALVLGLDLLSARAVETESEIIETIRDASIKMGEVLNEVIDLQNMEELRFRIIHYPFNVGDMVHLIKLNVAALLKHKSIRLNVFLSHMVPMTVIGDKTRIENVLFTLLCNASQYAPSGSEIKLSVTLDTEMAIESSTPANDQSITNVNNVLHQQQQRVCVKFSVTDYGPGLTEQDIRQMFMPFAESLKTQSLSNRFTTVGLSICRKVVEMHGGVLTVTSVANSGSTYSFTIPFYAMSDLPIIETYRNNFLPDISISGASTSSSGVEEENNHLELQPYERVTSLISRPPTVVDDIEADYLLRGPEEEEEELSALINSQVAENSRRNGIVGDGGNLYRVLIVDGSHSDRERLTGLLVKEGLSVETAVDGVVAIRETTGRVNRFNIIFLSLDIDVMSGEDTARQLRRMGYSHILIGVCMEQTRQEIELDSFILTTGMDCLLTKPIRSTSIKAILKYILKHGFVTGSSDMTDLL